MTLVFLVGYRCTGKSSVARLLAERWRCDWIDADAELERRAGKTIRQIFAEDGEPAFRDLESAVLADLSRRDNLVVATGGGVVQRPENRERLKAGRVIWLTAPAPVLWQRMQEDAQTAERRPNLAQGGLAEIESLLRAREPLYRDCAELTLDGSLLTPHEIVERIHRMVEGEGWRGGERSTPGCPTTIPEPPPTT